MKFVLQREAGEFRDVEVFNLHDVLKHQRLQHDFRFADLDEVKAAPVGELADFKPVGTLEFVGTWLRRVHGVQSMNPIEVPDILRTGEFLGRKYSVVAGRDVPRSGYMFCKDAGRLKGFSYSGPLELLADTVDKTFVDDNLYVVSQVVEILAEYRMIVVDDKVEAVQYYDGDPLVFPDADTLSKIVAVYTVDRQRPKAYALDVAVVPMVVDGDLCPVSSTKTIIIENHPTACFGTYGYVSSSLPYVYSTGVDYYVHVNKPISTFSNFSKFGK